MTNKKDGRWSETPQKPQKCKLCKGRGLVKIGNNVKGLQKCSSCNGTGIIEVEE